MPTSTPSGKVPTLILRALLKLASRSQAPSDLPPRDDLKHTAQVIRWIEARELRPPR